MSDKKCIWCAGKDGHYTDCQLRPIGAPVPRDDPSHPDSNR